MKKPVLFALAALVLPLAEAQAVPERVTRCWFETEIGCDGGGCEPEEVRCKAKMFGEIADPATVINNIVRLEVECDNGFDLDDDYAEELNEGDKTFVVGEEHGKTALLTLKNVLSHMNNGGEKIPATLVIADHEDALRLRGKCVQENVPLPPAPTR